MIHLRFVDQKKHMFFLLSFAFFRTRPLQRLTRHPAQTTTSFFFFSLKYPLWYYSLKLLPLFRINWQTDSMCQECQLWLKNEPQRTSFAVLIAHCWGTLHWRVVQQIVITVDKLKCCADVSSASLSSEFVWRKGSVRDKFFCFSVVFTVFYLGCLRGRSSPPPKNA